jgi:hypothetical protein
MITDGHTGQDLCAYEVRVRIHLFACREERCGNVVLREHGERLGCVRARSVVERQRDLVSRRPLVRNRESVGLSPDDPAE